MLCLFYIFSKSFARFYFEWIVFFIRISPVRGRWKSRKKEVKIQIKLMCENTKINIKKNIKNENVYCLYIYIYIYIHFCVSCELCHYALVVKESNGVDARETQRWRLVESR